MRCLIRLEQQKLSSWSKMSAGALDAADGGTVSDAVLEDGNATLVFGPTWSRSPAHQSRWRSM